LLVKPIPSSDPLHGHIRQIGVATGPRKLSILKRALALRGTPELRSQEQAADPMVFVKLFDPTSVWTFFVTEWDGDDTIFGFCIGMVSEFGYASLSEIASVPGALGIGLEIDVWFLPERLRVCLKTKLSHFCSLSEARTRYIRM
jgi:hypothetical protein